MVRTFLFVAGAAALDFVNTEPVIGGEPVDLVADDDDLQRWLRESRLGPAKGSLREAKALRADLGGPNVVSDWVTGKTEFPGYLAQLWIQAKAVGITIVWTAIVAFVSYKITDLVVGLRVTEEEEREGLDISSHGESAYRM